MGFYTPWFLMLSRVETAHVVYVMYRDRETRIIRSVTFEVCWWN